MFSFDLQMEGLMRTLAECERRGLDLTPPLREFGRAKRKEIIAKIESGSGFPPLAASTLAKYDAQSQADRKFTVAGTVRAKYAQRLDREKKRLDGLRKWAQKTYGDRIPETLRAKFQRFDDRMRKLQKTSAKRQKNMLFGVGQIGAEKRFAGQPMVEVRVIREGKRKFARIAGPGYGPAARAKLPTHLAKVGAVYQIPASALSQVKNNLFAVGATDILRTRKADAAGGGKVHKILGKVPGSIYYRVIRQNYNFALVYGSWWTKDGVHNKGDSHVPKREHISLTGEDVQHLTRILVRYGVQPLKGGA